MGQQLKRTIGLASATSIGLGAMLGAGIFVFPGLAGGQAGVAASLSFLIGGIIALLVAACTAELATAMPQSGGAYFFISRSFGLFWGTVVGIAQWVGLIFACAFYLVSFGEYAISLLEELGIPWTAGKRVLSFVFTFFLLVINILGTKKVGRLQNLMVISLTIILVLIFSYGLIDFFGIEEKSTAFSTFAPKGISAIFTTTALIFTSYLGFVQIANIGAEIRQPDKNLPRSLIGSVVIALILYVFIILVCTMTFPHEDLKRFGETATIEVARRMLGNWGAIVVVFAALLAALSSANASVISASRGVFALSKDRLITEKASAINTRFGTPHIALILVTLPVGVMVFGGRLEVFAEVASFLHLIIYAGICLSVLKLRATRPKWYIPVFRLPAARIIAVLGALCCLGLVFFMQRTSILWSLGVLLVIVGYYFLIVRRRSIQLSNPEPPHFDKELLHPHVLIPVDITQEKKDLPLTILEAIPVSRMLLVGYRETPEQSHSEQSAAEFEKSGQAKLDYIVRELENAKINFDKRLVFDHKILDQLREEIAEEQPQFILKLRPIAALQRIVIPIYDRSQIDNELSTLLYRLSSDRLQQIKVILFAEGEGDTSDASSLRQAIAEQFRMLNIQVTDFDVRTSKKESPQSFLQKNTENTDLVVWPEAAPSQRDLFMKVLLEKESKCIPAPVIMILKNEEENEA